jgi:hypothetical protein
MAARAQLWSAGAAKATAVTMGIVPAQGLLAPAPPCPPMPPNARALTVFALVALLPAALFHEYLYHRALAAGLAHEGALQGPEWGAYPLFLPVVGGGVPEGAAARAVAWAQALVLLSWVLWLATAVMHFAYRSHPVWRLPPTTVRGLLPAAAAAVALQLVYSHALTAAVGARSLFVGQPLDVWPAIVGWLLVSAALLHGVKAADAARYEYAMISLRAHFDTRLGMWSPR